MSNFWEGKRVLVTGGSGFIGTHLSWRLIELGSMIDIIDIQKPRWMAEKNKADRCSYIAADVISDEFRKHLLKVNYECIFHLAGSASVQLSVENPFVDFEVNLRGTLNLLETLRTKTLSPKLVYLSSAAVYGNPARSPIREEDATVPISPYGISKLAAERYLHVYSEIHGLPAVSVRPFSVYGSGQEKQVVFDIIRKIDINTDRLKLFGTGKEARDFIYVSDLTDALLLIAEKSDMSGEVYNLASGKSTGIAEIAREICRITAVSPEIEYLGSVRPGVPLQWHADISKIESLGFVPKVSMHEGLKRTVEWYFDTKPERQ